MKWQCFVDSGKHGNENAFDDAGEAKAASTKQKGTTVAFIFSPAALAIAMCSGTVLRARFYDFGFSLCGGVWPGWPREGFDKANEGLATYREEGPGVRVWCCTGLQHTCKVEAWLSLNAMPQSSSHTYMFHFKTLVWSFGACAAPIADILELNTAIHSLGFRKLSFIVLSSVLHSLKGLASWVLLTRVSPSI